MLWANTTLHMQDPHWLDGAGPTLQQDPQLQQHGAAWQRQDRRSELQILQQEGSGAAASAAGDTAPHWPAAGGGVEKGKTRKTKRGSKGGKRRERGVQSRLRKERELAAAVTAYVIDADADTR